MKVDIAPFRPKTILQGFALIYGLSILSCWLVNRFVQMVSIGPWEGDQIAASYMGVNWSLVIPLVFGVGMQKPWLWLGQCTPGSWDDVDEVAAEEEPVYART